MKNISRRVKNLKVLGYLLQTAPFVRAVILTGSMTTGRVTDKSDIDILIISKPGHLYTARFFVTALALITGKKRGVHDKNPAGKFCLNYYLSSDNLDILPHDKRCADFHRYIISVWDTEGIYERILRQNFWMRKHNIKIENQVMVEQIKKQFPIKNIMLFAAIQRISEAIFSAHFIEEKFFYWQKKLIESRKMFKMDKYRFVIAKDELRLHPRKTSN